MWWFDETDEMLVFVPFVPRLVCIVALAVGASGVEIKFTSPETKTLGKVWYVRKGGNVTIPCVTEEEPGDKYKGGMYLWKDKSYPGRGVLGFRRSILGDGTLLISEVQPMDTTRLECHVSRFDMTKVKVFSHSLVVYYIADFKMINPFVYTVPSCSETNTANKVHSLLEFLCAEHIHAGSKCPFSASKECVKKAPTEVPEGEGHFRLRIFVEQIPDKKFVVPECSLKCMKKNIITHLQQTGDDLLKRLTDREDRVKGRLFEGYIFEKDELINRHIRTICYGAYELLHFIVCLPCFPGSYMKYTYQFNFPEQRVSRCVQCDRDHYQDKFAMDNCIHCPSQGTTKENSTDDVGACSVSSWRIAYVYYVAGGVAAAVLIVSLIVLLSIIIERRSLIKEAQKQQIEESKSLIGPAAIAAANQDSGVETEGLSSSWAPSQFSGTAANSQSTALRPPPPPPLGRQSFAQSNNAIGNRWFQDDDDDGDDGVRQTTAAMTSLKRDVISPTTSENELLLVDSSSGSGASWVTEEVADDDGGGGGGRRSERHSSGE